MMSEVSQSGEVWVIFSLLEPGQIFIETDVSCLAAATVLTNCEMIDEAWLHLDTDSEDLSPPPSPSLPLNLSASWNLQINIAAQ